MEDELKGLAETSLGSPGTGTKIKIPKLSMKSDIRYVHKSQHSVLRFTYFVLPWIYLSGKTDTHIFRYIQLSAKIANNLFVPAAWIDISKITFFKENSFTRMVCKYIYIIFEMKVKDKRCSKIKKKWKLKGKIYR